MKADANWSIGVVTADFNPELTGPLKDGAIKLLKSEGIKNIVEASVPGALELPLAAKWLFDIKKVDAVIALGVVIRGETAHFDFVCNGSERGCSQLQLEYSKPVAFGVLTTENREQVHARITGRKGHKGSEVAEVVLKMLELKRDLND